MLINNEMPGTMVVAEKSQNIDNKESLTPTTATLGARTQVVTEKLNIIGLGNAAKGMKQGRDFDGSNIVLPVMAVICYDKNPRQSVNPKFQEIKAGIKERGKLPGSLAVTKRPGSQQYMLYMGGNTRLLAVQELWQETRDPAFQEINVIFCEWVSESDVISAHLIENEARADTTFWDKAKGLIALKRELEAETGETLSSRALEVHLKKLGMSVGNTMIQNYLFATDSLVPIGPLLRREDMRLLKPLISAHRQVAQQLHLMPDLYSRLIESTLEKYAADLVQDAAINATALCNILDEQLAKSINTSVNELRLMMSALVIDPTLSNEELRQTARTGPEAGSNHVSRSAPRQSATRKQAEAALIPEVMSTAPSAPGPSATTRSVLCKDPSFSVQAHSSENLERHVRELVTRLCNVAHVNECLRCFQNDLPLGFYMELPGELIDAAEVPDIHIRRATWQLLATLTGQFDQRIANRLPIESRWRQVMQLDTLNEKSFESEYTFLVQGICSEAGAPGTSAEDISYFFWHSETSALFKDLLDLAHAWRKVEPGRFNLQTINSNFAS